MIFNDYSSNNNDQYSAPDSKRKVNILRLDDVRREGLITSQDSSQRVSVRISKRQSQNFSNSKPDSIHQMTTLYDEHRFKLFGKKQQEMED